MSDCVRVAAETIETAELRLSLNLRNCGPGPVDERGTSARKRADEIVPLAWLIEETKLPYVSPTGFKLVSTEFVWKLGEHSRSTFVPAVRKLFSFSSL